MPLLSIIIPVYNAEKTIERTLLSLHWMSSESKRTTEVIIINDGSTDRSMDIIKIAIDTLSPLSVRVVVQDNKGLASARNAGLMRCSGKFVFLLDADDELAFDPVPHIQNNADATSVGFSVRYSTTSHRQWMKRPTQITLKNHLAVFTAENTLTASSILFRRDCIESLFDPEFLSLEDWLFWMMNPSIFERMTVFPEITSAVIHIHEENMTADQIRMGRYRRKVADHLLARHGDALNRTQKNNLKIQSQIGRIQQGEMASLPTFFLFPCALRLYGKLIVYAFAGTRLSRATLYSR